MRVVTWNCNGALRKKFNFLQGFAADITIIQECENPETAKDKKYKDWAKNYIWTGENNSKGLGVFVSEKFKIENLNWVTNELKYFIACKINNDFNLIGTWCHGANSSFGYIGQLWKYLQIHKKNLNKCIIAGDLNSNVIWDKGNRCWNHSDVIRELKELKVESLYHRYFQEEAGKELQSTFFLQRNPTKKYHIDYILASEIFIDSLKLFSIGQHDKWIAISDHMPVFCEI